MADLREREAIVMESGTRSFVFPRRIFDDCFSLDTMGTQCQGQRRFVDPEIPEFLFVASSITLCKNQVE